MFCPLCRKYESHLFNLTEQIANQKQIQTTASPYSIQFINISLTCIVSITGMDPINLSIVQLSVHDTRSPIVRYRSAYCIYTVFNNLFGFVCKNGTVSCLVSSMDLGITLIRQPTISVFAALFPVQIVSHSCHPEQYKIQCNYVFTLY